MGNAPKRRTPARRRTPSPSPGPATRPWLKYVIGVAVVAVLVGFIAYISRDVSSNPQGIAEAPAGTQTYTITEASHTPGPVTYDLDPPVGGPHNPEWLACRVYTSPVRNENAVHALEHGAVWITYDPNLDADSVAVLERFTERRREVLLSPYPGLRSPVVASAWGTQLELDSADSDLLDQFYRAFQDRTAPETAATC